MDLVTQGIIYIFIGFLAGLLSGILGIGGGIIVVPGLVFIFQKNLFIPESFVMQVAAATSLSLMIFTSQASLRAHYSLGEILWSAINKLWPGVALGTLTGALASQFIPTYSLKKIFAFFLVFVALKRLFGMKVASEENYPKPWINHVLCFFMGIISGLLGVGGGVLIVPYLLYCGLEVRKIPAVSNWCSFIVAVTGTAVYMFIGPHKAEALPYSIGYVYIPALLFMLIPSIVGAPLGAKLNYKLPVEHLQYLFIVILLLTALKMFF